MKITHCSECGARYAELTSPRHCVDCSHIHWFNPKPVVALIQPVLNEGGTVGLMIAKRAIEPKKGHWSLVGGFMEVGENVTEAATREFREETSLEVGSIPRIVFDESVGETGMQLMLMTYVDKPLSFEVFQQGVPCSENEELGILYAHSDIELAFPTHREAARKFFAGEYS